MIALVEAGLQAGLTWADLKAGLYIPGVKFAQEPNP